MAGLNVTALNSMLDGSSTAWPPDTLSLHSSDPGAGTSAATGTELSGNGPTAAYARQGTAFSAAASKSKSASTLPTFQVPAGSSVAFLGYWKGTTYLGCRALSATETYNGAGTYTPTSITESIS